jgi:hypothetical protein
MEEDTEANSRWQPMLLMLRNMTRRIECQCGTLAVITICTLTDKQDLRDVEHFCQSCYLKDYS